MKARALALLCLGVGIIASLAGGALRAQDGEKHAVSAEQYQSWKTELSNWGRWGKEDEIGALNLITPAKRRQAAALVKEGVSVSLAADTDTVKAVDNPSPYEVTMQGIGSDRIAINYHGIAHTHLDSLAHINEQGVFYNGYKPVSETVIKERHAKNSIHNVKNGIFTRGILIDIPRLKGVPYLEPGTPIYVEDLEAWEKQAGVKVVCRRRTVRADRCLGASKGARTVAAWTCGRRAVGRAPSVSASMAQSTRHRAARERPPAVRVAGNTRSAERSCARLRADLSGCPSLRQLRSGGARAGGSVAQALGVSVDGGSVADSRRHRITAQSDRDVLSHEDHEER